MMPVGNSYVFAPYIPLYTNPPRIYKPGDIVEHDTIPHTFALLHKETDLLWMALDLYTSEIYGIFEDDLRDVYRKI